MDNDHPPRSGQDRNSSGFSPTLIVVLVLLAVFMVGWVLFSPWQPEKLDPTDLKQLIRASAREDKDPLKLKDDSPGYVIVRTEDDPPKFYKWSNLSHLTLTDTTVEGKADR